MYVLSNVLNIGQHTKRQVHKIRVFKMFITVVFVIFLIKLRWPKTTEEF